MNTIVSGLKNVNLPIRLKTALNDLKKEQNIVITKADKGGKVVILNSNDYCKLEDILSDHSTYERVNKEPLKPWQQQYNRDLKRILKDHSELAKKYLSFLPSLPYMYGLPKIHKPGNPLRPIVSSTGSVTHRLSKYLASLLSPLLGSISHSHLINSDDFVSKVRGINLKDKILVSFDVDSLFTNVPVEETLSFLRNHLQTNPLNLPFSIDIFLELIDLCAKKCLFYCNNRYYNQIRGFPMGSCLSPILSNLFMEYFERDLLPSVVDFELVWYRYVDDVFAVIPNTVDVDNFLSKLNCLVPSIKFKIEKENNNSLPFLDLLVIRNHHKPSFKIYRKPTHSNMYIHAYSSHSENIKLGTIVSLFLRAYRICDHQFIGQEINFIFDTFYQLGYNRQFIEKAHFKARNIH